ncbi:hypothetical protein FQN57_003894 [Myotisia sp. PD_48]|nr:hypothetical protein FQN57_003894 [Myotisia sp. PD_48]
MDQSLDEIIAERPNPRNRDRRGNRPLPLPPPIAVFLKMNRIVRDWVHDKFEDDIEPRSAPFSRGSRSDRYNSQDQNARGAKLRITNLHYDLTQEDLEELFSRIGPVSTVSLVYDRAGRSEGVAFVTYQRLADANTAIREFDGANAKGQPIRLSLLSTPPPKPRNPFDTAELPKGSLFDRAERPRNRDTRSLSPEAEDGGRRNRRSDVTKPAPEHIDRYIPGRRSPIHRNVAGRGNGRRGRDTRDGSQSRNRGGRSRKTQEELDKEMEDYWQQTNTTTEPANGAQQAVPAPTGDDDIDMIE